MSTQRRQDWVGEGEKERENPGLKGRDRLMEPQQTTGTASWSHLSIWP